MADRLTRLPDNLPGKFYVDDSCLDCDACRALAPANFARNDDKGYSFVIKQPTTPEEVALCRRAAEECHVEAIGMDGEQAQS